MKKIYALFTSILIAGAAMSQSMLITNTAGDDITNTVYTISGSDFIMDEGFKLQNLAEFTAPITLKRYELDVAAGTKNYFCWGLCFEAIDAGAKHRWQSEDTISVASMDFENSSHVYHMPQGIAQNSSYLYVYYNTDDPTDSVWVEVNFDVDAWVGIEDLNASSVKLNASPNPATNALRISYNLGDYRGNNAKLVLVDLLGKQHGEFTLESNTTTLDLDITDLVSGIYFYSVQVEGRLIDTKKVIVN